MKSMGMIRNVTLHDLQTSDAISFRLNEIL